jgi:hypothetical protein
MYKIVFLATQEIQLLLDFTWRQAWFAMQIAFLQEFLLMMKQKFNAFKRVATGFL